MTTLLILWAGQTGHTHALAAAAADAARLAAPTVTVRLLPARSAGLDDLLAADGVLFATPENFGYMAGALKDFFDRTFYPAQGRVEGRPYALLVSAGNDGR
ncbi:flavodoxin family protein, partial [Laribacter hongkongensis]